MTNQPKKVLIADDDIAIRTVLSQALKREGYQVDVADNGATLYEWVLEGRGDLVLTDVMMPGENGIDLIPKIHAVAPHLKVIVMSAQNPLTTAMAASEKGALDYLAKPFDIDDLIALVKKSFDVNPAVEQNNVQTVQAVEKDFVIGQSRAMQEIYRTIVRLRDTDLTVLLSGESGTGKEVIARALHAYSQWKNGPFVAVNMAAIPRELIESELFGHEKGAFTGATQKTMGKFGQANGGTLFLDEIGDMPFEAQTRLLRVLQEGEFVSIGGNKPVKTNVRVIAATHQDIASLVSAGKFREDLYYRLNVIPMAVPPLRQRQEDIPDLVQHFIARSGAHKVFSSKAMQILKDHTWRGNIRELENVVKRLTALCAENIIDDISVAQEIARTTHVVQGQARVDMKDVAIGLFDTVENKTDVYTKVMSQLEKPLIEHVLSMTNGHQLNAADILGLNRNTLRKKIRDLNIVIQKTNGEG